MEILFVASCIILVFLSWLPVIIAFKRKHKSKWGIFALNFTLGWTGIFWIIALVWSLSNKGDNVTIINNVTNGNGNT